MRSEYQAHNDMKVDKKEVRQDEIRAKNLALIRREQAESAANIAKFDRFIKNALFIVIGLFIALLLREYGIWA